MERKNHALTYHTAAGFTRDSHSEGIDIFAPRDTPVRSTTRGIVTRVGTNKLGGQVVFVLGPGLESHYYAHLERLPQIRPGDIVQAGMCGGTSGVRATRTRPHFTCITRSIIEGLRRIHIHVCAAERVALARAVLRKAQRNRSTGAAELQR